MLVMLLVSSAAALGPGPGPVPGPGPGLGRGPGPSFGPGPSPGPGPGCPRRGSDRNTSISKKLPTKGFIISLYYILNDEYRTRTP
jgi:hypothetical protein